MTNLPPLRKKIYSESLKIILIFGITSIAINLITIISAISITPNYNTNITIEDIVNFQENTKLLKIFVFVESLLFAFISLLGSFIIADRLSNKIAYPLKTITSILRSKPQLGHKIVFPTPSALELKSLTDEFSQLWDRLGEAEKGNIEKFKKQNQELETILSSVEDAVMVIDCMNKVSQINNRMCRILNLEENATIDQVFDDLPTASENYIKMRDLVQTHNGLGNTIFHLQTDSEKIQYYSGRVKNVFSNENKILSRIILLHDITEIRLRNNLRTECTLELSLELQRPLQEAFDIVNKLVESNKELSNLKRLEQIVANTSVIASRLEQISSLNDETLSVTPQAHDLSIFLRIQVSNLMSLAQERGVTLRLHPLESCLVNLDIEKFPWVIKNLVLTCINNAPEKTAVQVKLNLHEHLANISIWDVGPEYPESIKQYLHLKRFTELGHNIQTSSNSGLWLNIAKSITEELHGSLNYNFSSDNGNLFSISLPILNT